MYNTSLFLTLILPVSTQKDMKSALYYHLVVITKITSSQADTIERM